MTYMLLKIFVEDETLRDKYNDSIEKHNKKMNEYYTDAGFDLFCPDNVDIINNFHKKIALKQRLKIYTFSIKKKKSDS